MCGGWLIWGVRDRFMASAKVLGEGSVAGKEEEQTGRERGRGRESG